MKIILGTDVIRYPLTGTGRYAYEIGKGLLAHKEITLQFFQGNHLYKKLPEPSINKTEFTSTMTMLKKNITGFLTRYPFLLKGHRYISENKQARVLQNTADSIFHGPSFYLPKHSGPSIVTFHDLSVIHHPEFHPPGRVRYMLEEFPAALRRANILLTISEHARKELITYSGFPPEKVICTPLAASADFFPRDKQDCLHVLNKYSLEYQKFCFFAGTIEPRKNLSILLDAYEMLPKKFRACYPLIVSGFHGWKSEDIHARLISAQNSGWVKYLDFVPASDLPFLFSAAKIFVFPSRYEGFGLPLLESMASGVPVVCSNVTSLPEVAGDCALMCHPDDTDELSTLIKKAIEDDTWRASSIKNGIKHAASFSWEKTVDKTIEAYQLASL